jgi:putative ABC transport system permease protein
VTRGISETLRLALTTVLRHPGRSGLTVLGLTIGVAAFIAMVSFGEGARRSVIAQFETLGVHVLKIKSLSGSQAGRGRMVMPLTDQDVARLRKEGTTLDDVVPFERGTLAVSAQGQEHFTAVYATVPPFATLRRWQLAAGGMFDDADLAQRAKVCVIGATVLRRIFEGSDPLGQTLIVGRAVPCRVIGVLAEKGFSTAGTDLDDTVLMPATTYRAHLSSSDRYTEIHVSPLEPALLDAARLEVADILRRSHGLGDLDENDFEVSSPREVVDAAEHTSRILSRLLQGIAAVSLLVGGIGIMNIQLVSIAERTEEIGIRSAIGASPRQILGQFLSEALALALIGAAAGVGLGIAAASIVAHRMGWPRVISPAAVTLSALFGIAVGMVFGFLPARHAARMNPIEALRHE